MIAALKRAAMQLFGVAPVLPPIGELRKGYLRQAGYRVHHNQGRWHWYRGHGNFSGRCTTERAAWLAAAEDHDKEIT